MDELIAGYKELLSELLASDSYSFDTELGQMLPRAAGIYRIFRRGSGWQDSIYVGHSNNLRKQIYVYDYIGIRSESTLKRKLIRYDVFSDEKAIQMFLETECYVQFKEVLDENDKVWLRHFALAVLKPVYND